MFTKEVDASASSLVVTWSVENLSEADIGRPLAEFLGISDDGVTPRLTCLNGTSRREGWIWGSLTKGLKREQPLWIDERF